MEESSGGAVRLTGQPAVMISGVTACILAAQITYGTSARWDHIVTCNNPLSMEWHEALEKSRSVRIGFQGHPTLIAGSPPASRDAIESVRELARDFVPEEYLSLLRITDGVFLLPWDEHGVAGVELFSANQLESAHELAEETATGDDHRYFVVGRLHSASSDFIAVDAEGAVWWLKGFPAP